MVKDGFEQAALLYLSSFSATCSTDCRQAEIPVVCRFLRRQVCRECALLSPDYSIPKFRDRRSTDYDSLESCSFPGISGTPVCQMCANFSSEKGLPQYGLSATTNMQYRRTG